MIALKMIFSKKSYWRTIGIDACRASADDKKNSTYIEDSVIEAYYIDECNAGRALKRTAFLSTKPDNCCYGKIREHKCATCRSGWENRAKLHSVHLECEEQHSLWNCPLLKCEEWKDCIHTDKEFEKHRQLDKSQRKLYKAIREDEEEAGRWRLKNGECLVCMDFSPYSGNYVRLRTMSEAMSSVQCLHLVAFKKSDGKITKQYFDYFGDESNDIYFVRHVLTDLVGKFNNENIVIRQIFSDGGPKHFRTRRSLGFVLVELALIANYSLPVTWHFFCANHGKSECDSRAAVVKTFLNRLAIRGYSSFGLDEVVVNNNYIQKLSDRNACIIDGIDRSEVYDFTIIPHVRSYNCLEWTRDVLVLNESQAAENNVQKEAYQIQCKIFSLDDDKHADYHYIEPLFDICANNNKKKEGGKKGGIKKTSAGVAKHSNVSALIKESKVADREFQSMRLPGTGLVDESQTVVITEAHRRELQKQNVRLAIRMADGESGLFHWYAASGRKFHSVQKKREVEGQKQREFYYQWTIIIDMDDKKDPWQAKEINIDAYVRLLVSN